MGASLDGDTCAQFFQHGSGKLLKLLEARVIERRADSPVLLGDDGAAFVA